MKKFWTLTALLVALTPMTLTGCGSEEAAPVEIDENFDAQAAEEEMAESEEAPEGPAP
jgi:hypothetical protein